MYISDTLKWNCPLLLIKQAKTDKFVKFYECFTLFKSNASHLVIDIRYLFSLLLTTTTEIKILKTQVIRTEPFKISLQNRGKSLLFAFVSKNIEPRILITRFLTKELTNI